MNSVRSACDPMRLLRASYLLPSTTKRRDLDDIEAMIAKYVAFTPLRRPIDPDDVANAVVFLASERARNITGEVIHVCAGSHLPPTV